MIEGKSKERSQFIPNLAFFQHVVFKINYLDPCEEVGCFDVMISCGNCRIPLTYMKLSDDSLYLLSSGICFPALLSCEQTFCVCEYFCSVGPLQSVHV